MLILALDLSLTSTGYAIIESDNKTRKAELIKYGLIKTNSKDFMGQRLKHIVSTLQNFIECDYSFDAVVRESSFSNNFISATQKIFLVNGAVTYGLFDLGIDEIYEVHVTTVKKTITGDGKAKKDKVQENLAKYVGWHTYKTFDESDAVAVGLTWLIKNDYINNL